jgi:hypothetical protein
MSRNILFRIWRIFVNVSDAFLKPLLLDRGDEVPMLGVLVGAIGGLMLSGLIGLFLDAVILSIGYPFFKAWLGITTVLSEWNVAPALNDGQFNFVPPKGTTTISFMPVETTGGSNR